MMNHKVVTDVVRELIGSIDPVGDSREDDSRLTHLRELIGVVDTLLGDISRVAQCTSCYQASMKKAGKIAAEFLREVAETEEG